MKSIAFEKCLLLPFAISFLIKAIVEWARSRPGFLGLLHSSSRESKQAMLDVMMSVMVQPKSKWRSSSGFTKELALAFEQKQQQQHQRVLFWPSPCKDNQLICRVPSTGTVSAPRSSINLVLCRHCRRRCRSIELAGRFRLPPPFYVVVKGGAIFFFLNPLPPI